MKQFLKIAMLLSLLQSTAFAAEQKEDWQDAGVVERNRYPMTATFETGGNKLSLNGVWDFKFYELIADRSMDFFRTDYAA